MAGLRLIESNRPCGLCPCHPVIGESIIQADLQLRHRFKIKGIIGIITTFRA